MGEQAQFTREQMRITLTYDVPVLKGKAAELTRSHMQGGMLQYDARILKEEDPVSGVSDALIIDWLGGGNLLGVARVGPR